MLPIALGKGTRVVQTLLPSGKEYVCLMYLHSQVPEEKIRGAVKNFTGRIKQLPPRRSAIKRQSRHREIYYFNILEMEGQYVLFKIGCQAGTYIRKLCLHPDTEVLSTMGCVPASDFYSNPQRIFSFNKGKVVGKNPSAVQRFSSPKNLIKLAMSSGIHFIVTHDHEVLKSDLDGYNMVKAKNLRKGDYLVKSLNFPSININYCLPDLLDDNFLIPQADIKRICKKAFIKRYGSIRAMNRHLNFDRKAFLSNSKCAITIKHLKLSGVYNQMKDKIKIFKTEKGQIIRCGRLNNDLCYLLGLLASDGNNTREKKTIRHTRLKFHNKNEALIDTFLKIYTKIFPNIPISKKKIKSNIFQLDTSNSFFATIAASLGVKSPQKCADILPVLYLKTNFIKYFLKGYFDGDGTCYFKKKIKGNTYFTDIRFFSANYTTAKRLHQMLLKLSISNKIFIQQMKPNRIYHKQRKIYIVSLEGLPAKHKFIREVGSNHPNKITVLNKISKLKNKAEIFDHYPVGFHYKGELKKNKKGLHSMGGNLSRVLKNNNVTTRGFYKKCSKIVKLPPLDNVIVERIKSVEYVPACDYVYDMTVPNTHNFLIETGFVSSNCHDLGLKLGTNAHMAQLIRTKAGPFNDRTWVTLHDLKDAYEVWKSEGDDKPIRKVIQPFEFAVSHLPKVWVFDTTVDSLCHGAVLSVPGISKLDSGIEKNNLVAVFTLKGELVCLGEALMSSGDMMKSEKGLAVKTSKVFMDPDVYPKYVKDNQKVV